MKQSFVLMLAILLAVPGLADKGGDSVRAGALKLLVSGAIHEFNKWREQEPDVAINLTRVNLRGVNLEQANLAGVDFSEADLTGAKLWRAYFYRANLRGANLTGVSIDETDFRGASYIYATMSKELLSEMETQNRRTVTITK